MKSKKKLKKGKKLETTKPLRDAASGLPTGKRL
jgi:hypothetical protein